MEKIKSILTIALLSCVANISFSQTLNFGNFKKEDKHIVTVNAGLEHGLVFGAGYGYRIKSQLPVIINAEFSLPSGETIFDDFKTKIGGQMRIYQNKNFHVIGKVQGIFRRTQNDFVRLLNFGSDMTGTAGYFKKKWFAAAELGFDKAIVTHFKHTESYKQVYAKVQDGWFDPSTGGHFYYSILAGYSFKASDVYIKYGKITSQNFNSKPLP
jgi:hypothetical protein